MRFSTARRSMGCQLRYSSAPIVTAHCRRSHHIGTIESYLVDPASSHMLVSKTKPCMSKYKLSHSQTANGSLNQLWFLRQYHPTWITVAILELIHARRLRPLRRGKGALFRSNLKPNRSLRGLVARLPAYTPVLNLLTQKHLADRTAWSRRRIFQMSALSHCRWYGIGLPW